MVPVFDDFPSSAITVEFWMRSYDTCRPGVPFSYAHGKYEKDDNAFLIFNYNSWCEEIMIVWTRVCVFVCVCVCVWCVCRAVRAGQQCAPCIQLQQLVRLFSAVLKIGRCPLQTYPPLPPGSSPRRRAQGRVRHGR